jgi:hypothetical protein
MGLGDFALYIHQPNPIIVRAYRLEGRGASVESDKMNFHLKWKGLPRAEAILVAHGKDPILPPRDQPFERRNRCQPRKTSNLGLGRRRILPQDFCVRSSGSPGDKTTDNNQ